MRPFLVINFFTKNKFTLASIFIFVALAFIAYLPDYRIGFLDGWWYLDWVSRFDLPRYILQFVDPVNITQGYRPVQGLYIWVLYAFFQFNSDGYHFAHIVLHAANSILLFAITRRLARNWRIGLLAAFVYVALPLYSLAVFWHAVVDPLAAFFYLLTLFFWTRYLELERRREYAAAFVAFLFALLSKEIAIFLPLMLFLIERLFFPRTLSARAIARRYALFLAPLAPYVALVVAVQSHGEFVSQFGFQFGPQMLVSLTNYFAALAFPWLTARPTDWLAFAWLAFAALIFLFVAWRLKNTRLIFLALFAALNIAPLTGFPLDYFGTRYLYLSVMASAVVFALLVQFALTRFSARRMTAPLIAGALALMSVSNGAQIADAAAGLAEYTRQLRVPFRDIARAHPTFPPDSYLYFVYSPYTPLSDLQGFFLVRYGQSLIVSGTEDFEPARLRAHANSFVYYFDADSRPHEINVPANEPAFAPALPLEFNAPIRLEGIEIVNPIIRRGDPLIVLLYWRATGKIEKDFSVFAHWLDARGNMLGGADTAPRQGNAPTRQWKLNQLVVDALTLPIENSSVDGNPFQIEIGMYDQNTLERLSFVDANGVPFADKVVIDGIRFGD
ncbi:MAG: glycosyltransferase family 39 protein [Chloroflexi bacterium]|nr:glycosyltransferase family 39 protein [Chloroflexota bacterium]